MFNYFMSSTKMMYQKGQYLSEWLRSLTLGVVLKEENIK